MNINNSSNSSTQMGRLPCWGAPPCNALEHRAWSGFDQPPLHRQDPLQGTRFCAASFQKFKLDKRAQPLGDLNFQRACRSEHEQGFWDLRPSI